MWRLSRGRGRGLGGLAPPPARSAAWRRTTASAGSRRCSRILCGRSAWPPRALLDVRPPEGSPAAAPLAAAIAEWRAALLARADFPETHLQIGGAGLTTRDWRLAEHAFTAAASLDPQLVDAWTMLVRIRAATGDLAGAQTALAEALARNPGNAALEALRAELGGL